MFFDLNRVVGNTSFPGGWTKHFRGKLWLIATTSQMRISVHVSHLFAIRLCFQEIAARLRSTSVTMPVPSQSRASNPAAINPVKMESLFILICAYSASQGTLLARSSL